MCSFNILQAESAQYFVHITATTDTQTYGIFVAYIYFRNCPKMEGEWEQGWGISLQLLFTLFYIVGIAMVCKPLELQPYSQPSGVSLRFHGNVY